MRVNKKKVQPSLRKLHSIEIVRKIVYDFLVSFRISLGHYRDFWVCTIFQVLSIFSKLAADIVCMDTVKKLATTIKTNSSGTRSAVP